jgi:hypothetical protein
MAMIVTNVCSGSINISNKSGSGQDQLIRLMDPIEALNYGSGSSYLNIFMTIESNILSIKRGKFNY